MPYSRAVNPAVNISVLLVAPQQILKVRITYLGIPSRHCVLGGYDTACLSTVAARPTLTIKPFQKFSACHAVLFGRCNGTHSANLTWGRY